MMDDDAGRIAELEAEIKRLEDALNKEVTARMDDLLTVGKALSIAHRYSQIDGDFHKVWAIDQMVRALLGDEYDAWVSYYVNDGEYTWDEGIAP